MSGVAEALEAERAAPYRGLITVSVMLAAIPQSLDTTIANVALAHMQGTIGATYDQASWVLTSYIVAAAICMPLTGFLSARFGRKRVFMWSVACFTIASMLCGAAQTLTQIVLFRLLQGAFGASLIPLSQSVLLDTFPRAQHGSAMALWGVGVMVGPILGPTLGGWLTEYYSWRWIFYINLPFGLLAWFGLALHLRESETATARRFDLFGFAMLALGIGALQMMLDRGELLDWFSSTEIVVEALLASLGLYLFGAHILTHDRPFLEPALFRDRNFNVGLLFIFILGMCMLTTIALVPPFLQNLMGYPVVDVGLMLAPRGVGSMISMLAVGRLSGRVDARLLIVSGLLLMTISQWEMTQFDLNISRWDIVRTGMLQGIGIGLVWVPLTTTSFSTLAPRYRTEGTAFFSLVRNLGMSVGISVVVALLSRNLQSNHAALAQYIDPFSLALRQAVQSGVFDLGTQEGLVALDIELTRQAATLAYLQNFRLIMFVTLGAMPLVLLIRPRAASSTTLPVTGA